MAGWIELGAAALGGGGVSALLSPWVTYGVEQRRDDRRAKRDLIRDVRELLAVARDLGWGFSEIEADRRYLEIQRHMTAEARSKMRDPTIVVIDSGATRGVYNRAWLTLRDETDRLAKEWKV